MIQEKITITISKRKTSRSVKYEGPLLLLPVLLASDSFISQRISDVEFMKECLFQGTGDPEETIRRVTIRSGDIATIDN